MDSKAKIILSFFGLGFLVLAIKLFQLQVLDSQYRGHAKNVSRNQVIVYPSRGQIFDRNHKLMVSNSPIYDIDVIYNNLPKNLDTTALCNLLDITKEQFLANMNKNWKSPRYHKSIPYTFLSKIKPERFSFFQEHLYKFPGFIPVKKSIRNYSAPVAAHVLGFLGEVDKDDVKTNPDIYRNGDYIGKSGLERTYEYALRGKKGVRYVMKDNVGRIVGAYNQGKDDTPPESGADLTISLDLDLQKYGEFLMDGKMGSIVAIEPKSGEILAMVSTPSYNPQLLSMDRNRGAVYDSLSRDTLYRPLFDRSVSAKYPPGSIFKPILSLIALQKGLWSEDRTIYCDGTYEVDSRGLYVQKCHQHPTPYNIALAIQYSCNSYFYQMLREFIDYYGYSTPGVGLDTLDSYLYDFGLGHKLGIDYHTEEKGFIPTKEYYDRQYSHVINGWRSTYILSLGIGQGELLLTTIQMANLAALIANRGFYYTPHLAKAFSKSFDIDQKYKTKKNVRIDDVHFEKVIEGMHRVTTQGTGTLASVPGIEVCGKTGTSQNKGKDHSVFFAFAPKDDPKIAIAVYVENGGFGGSIAAPIAGLMIEKYLNRKISERRKYLENRVLNTHLIDVNKRIVTSQNQSNQ